MNAYPVLYSFRRCPYAMRARLALLIAEQPCELREVVLRDKPTEMIALSPKATVPVLQLSDGTVLEESLDIMKWALSQNDPAFWLPDDKEKRQACFQLIEVADTDFKHNLDRYKYPGRYDGADPLHHRAEGLRFLSELSQKLAETGHLVGASITIADMAIVPFVRQFAHVDKEWFDSLDLPHLQSWLARHLASDLFQRIMVKHPQWSGDNPPVTFP